MITFEGCDSGANPFAEKYFRDCVYTYRDLVGFGLGLVSILVWLTAQLPQFISNIANQSSEALSIWFLVEWFAGDTLSLMGCIIQGQQLPTTTMLAAYFVLVDVLMLIQYIYYGALQARRARQRAKAARRRQHGAHTPHHHHRHHHHHSRHDSHDQGRDSSMRRANGAVVAVEASCPGPVVTSGQEGSDIGVAPVVDTSPSGAATAPVSLSSAGDVGTLGSTATAVLHKGTAVLATAVSLICFSAAVFGSGHIHGPGAQGQGASLLLLGGGSSSSSSSSMSDWGGSSASARSLQQLTESDILSEGEGGGRGSSSSPSNESLSCSFLNCDWALVAGTVMGYMSTCFYLASRVSQIKKNLQRRSTAGLSTYMFLLTITANTCTGMSIALRLRDMEQFKEQLPWMCGTFGTIALDMVLFYQALTLGGGKSGGRTAGEQQQRVEPGPAGGASGGGSVGGADGAVRDGAAKQVLLQHGGSRPAGAARTQQRAGPSRLGGGGRGSGLNGEEDLEAPLLGPSGQDIA